MNKHVVDRAGWGPGPWDDEPDDKKWIDPTTGYECLALRSRRSGAWCGYVRVATDHPLHGLARSAVIEVPPERLVQAERTSEIGPIPLLLMASEGLDPQSHCRLDILIDVHFGLTFGGEFSEEHGGGWWFGFDCNHCGDCGPGMDACRRRLGVYGSQNGTYRDLDFVTKEVTKMASQLACWGGKP